LQKAVLTYAINIALMVSVNVVNCKYILFVTLLLWSKHYWSALISTLMNALRN